MYLLDSDTTSLLFRGRNARLNERVLGVAPTSLWLPVIVLEEQYRGRLGVLGRLNPNLPKESALIPIAYRDLAQTQEFLRQFQILPYTQAEEDLYQSWSSEIKRIGRQDCRIAAIAVQHNLIVITANLRHFERMPGVKSEDWSQ